MNAMTKDEAEQMSLALEVRNIAAKSGAGNIESTATDLLNDLLNTSKPKGEA